MGRPGDAKTSPFRFILNRSAATAANVYLLLYPKEPLRAALAADEALFERVWGMLGELSAELVREGRVYGGGLHKLEPKELANTPAGRLAVLIPGFGERPKRSEQVGLFRVVSVR